MSTESTDPQKLPPRTHKAPKRYADEQDDPGPAKKKKGTAKSAEKSITTLEKPTKKKTTHLSMLKTQNPKPKPTVTATAAQKTMTSVDSEVEEVADPADRQRQQSEPAASRDPTQTLEPECADSSDDESKRSEHSPEDDDIEILEEPAESAEMELSLY